MLRTFFLVLIGALSLAPMAIAAEAPPIASSVADSDERTPVAVPIPTPRALQYYRTGNWLWGFNQIWGFAIPAVILWSGLSARLRNAAQRFAFVGQDASSTGKLPPLSPAPNGKTPPHDELEIEASPPPRTKGRLRCAGSWFLTIGIYVVLYLLIVFLIDLPLSYYQGFVRQHEYGLSNQSFARWFSDSWKQLGVEALTGFLFTWIPLLLIARRPRRWWLDTTLLTIPFLFVVVLVKPVWVDPLFNRFGPMKNQELERKIVALAEQAGIGGSEIFEVDKSRDTKAMNAYVTGVFGTRRVVLWDTLIGKLDDRQVLAVMGHEMGHYVLGHIPRSIVLSSVLTFAGLFWVDRAGRWLIRRNQGRFGFEQLSDAAAIPLILLLMHASSLVFVPFANAYSRYQEHEADRFSLEITRSNRSAAQAFATLQRENLSNPRPGLFFKAWRSTHPSIAERIEFCNAYRPWETGKPLRYGELWRR